MEDRSKSALDRNDAGATGFELVTVLVTGGIGSGKSAVCRILSGLGVPVYDSDSRTKALYDSNPEIVDALEAAFGVSLRMQSDTESVSVAPPNEISLAAAKSDANPNASPDTAAKAGILDRRKLAGIVFSDAAKLAQLEAVVYPYVLQDFKSWKAEQTRHLSRSSNISRILRNDVQISRPFVVMESAVALDKPAFAGSYDFVVEVAAPEAVRVARAEGRGGVAAETITERIKAQKTVSGRADALIVNDSTFEVLQERTLDAFRTLSLLKKKA